MKRRYAAILLSMVLGLTMLNGCGKADKETKTGTMVSKDKEDKNTIYGEVSQITEDTITIKVGTRKEREHPEEGNGGRSEGEMPGKPSGERPEGEAPEKPSGEQPEGEMPEKPSGEQPGEIPSMLELTGEEQEIQVTENTLIKREEMGRGSDKEAAAEEIKISDLAEGDMVQAVFAEDGSTEEILVISPGKPGGAGQSSQPENYEAVKEYDKDAQEEGQTVDSEGTDENAVLISQGANTELKNFKITRKSQKSTGGDNASFYGVGAAVLAEEGTAYLSESMIETDAAGGAGVFAYGNGTIYVKDTSVVTQQNTSGGIHAAGGGNLYAWDMKIETNGESAAAIRSDRGGGTMVVDGGTYISNGVGSPAVYSTADIAVNNAALTANSSEAVCIEGLNSLRLYNSDLTGTMGEDERNDCTWNVILYQSMSGDSEVGNSTFEMQGGSLKANHGGMFYTTNTESTIVLSGVAVENASYSTFFLKCTGNQNQRGWGTAGNNGADCHFTAVSQSMEGDVVWDSISQLDIYMEDHSSLTGAVIQDESCAGEGGEGSCNLYLGEDCIWTVTGNSVLSSLSCEGKIVDNTGKTVTIQGKDGTVYAEGESSYLVTVEHYGESADFSGASELTNWMDEQVQKPAQFI